MQFKRKLRVAHNILDRRSVRGRLTMSQIQSLDKGALLDLLDMGWDLPLGGATTAQNNAAANPVYFPHAIVVSTDQTINQGDMVWWDRVNYTLKPLTTSSQVAVGATGGFCGIAAGSNVPGVYPNPPAGTPSENLPGIEVQVGGSVYLQSLATDPGYYPFQIVTAAGVDAQTVTGWNVETSADEIGFVIVRPPVTPRAGPGATPVPETTTGRVEIWIERKFPTTGLL